MDVENRVQAAPAPARTAGKGPISKWTSNASRIVLAPLCANIAPSAHADMSSCVDQSSIAQQDESITSISGGAVAAAMLSPASDRRTTAARDTQSLFSPAFLAQHSRNASKPKITIAEPIPSPQIAQAESDEAPQETAVPAPAVERKARLTLEELAAREASCKALMSAAGEVCMAAWVTALEASKEYRRVRKEWRGARAKLQKRQGKARTLEPAPQLVQPIEESDEAVATSVREGEEEESVEPVDQVEQLEHAVQVLQSVQVEADEELASFHSGQLCLRTAVAAPDALCAERALEGLVDEVLAASAEGFNESQRLLEEQQRRYTLELAAHSSEGGLVAGSVDQMVFGEPLPPLEEEIANEAELLQLTIESEEIKRQLAATDAEECALRAEEERILREQAQMNPASLLELMQAEGGVIPEGHDEDASIAEAEEELENYVVTKPRRLAATVHATSADTQAAPSNGVLMFSPPKVARPSMQLTAAQRKSSLALSRANAAAEKERRAALRRTLESDLAAHEDRRQQLLDAKHAKSLEAERRRVAAREKVESAEAARRSKFARVVEAAAGIEEARKLRHAEETKLLRAQAKSKLIKAAQEAAAATHTAEGEEGACSGETSSCKGCERCNIARMQHAEERRKKHLAELRERCTNEDDIARHRASVAAKDASGARQKTALLEESERRRVEAEARRARSIEEGKLSKQAAKEKKRRELEQQLADIKKQPTSTTSTTGEQ